MRGDAGALMEGTPADGTSRGGVVSLSGPEVWGVLNVTPDSFSDGGLYPDAESAVAAGRRMAEHGAAVVDVGGESSRPSGRSYGEGAVTIPASEELARVLPVVKGLVQSGVRVSVDTVKPQVAKVALEEGATIINDVSCGASTELLEAVASFEAELVLMHNRGRGEVDAQNTSYGDLVEEVRTELLSAVERAVSAGVREDRVWLDPGIGFAKTARQSIALLAYTGAFVDTGHRILVGPSRKSFIADIVGASPADPLPPSEREPGTAAAVTQAILAGARAVRVHDVESMVQVTRVAHAMRTAFMAAP